MTSIFRTRWRGNPPKAYHLPWGFRVGRLHVTWYDAWKGRCTLEELVIWSRHHG